MSLTPVINEISIKMVWELTEVDRAEHQNT